MAKKTTKQPEETRLAEPGPVQKKPYTVGEWSGLPQYQCRYCSFDAMREDGILAHVETVHFPTQQPLTEPGKILVADKHGNPVSQAGDERLIGVYEVNLEEVLNNATNSPD